MDLSILFKLVDTSKLGGWVRAGVAAGLGLAIAKWPLLATFVDPATQAEIGAVAATLVVGVWSHFAKSVANGIAAQDMQAAKKVAPVLLALVFAGGILGACSTQTANNVIAAATTYDNAVQNFNAAAAAINGSIALTSQTVGPYCNAAQTTGQNLVKLAIGSATATTALNMTAAALDAYCTALPTDIQGAIVALTNAAVAAKQAASK